MQTFLRAARDVGLLLLRLVVGATMLARGWQRWQVAGIDAEVAVVTAAGLPNPTLVVWLVIAFEIAGGLLLLFGLGTPLVGLGIVVLQGGIIAWHRGAQGLFVHEQGWEYNAVLAAVGVVLLTQGAGRLGLDALFARPHDERESPMIADPQEAAL